MIIVRPYSLWPVRSASELLLAAVIWPYFRKVILYYIEEPQFYRYTLQYTILRREKGGKIARHVRRHVNKRLSLNYYNERRSTYTHRVAEWNHDANDDIIVVVVYCCFFFFSFFFIIPYIIVYFLSLVHYVMRNYDKRKKERRSMEKYRRPGMAGSFLMAVRNIYEYYYRR